MDDPNTWISLFLIAEKLLKLLPKNFKVKIELSAKEEKS